MKLTRGGLGAWIVAAGAAALLLAACGNGEAAKSSSGTTRSKPITIGTESVTGVGTVLDTSQGLTLYHNTSETGGTIVCTGSCATQWPPVLVSGALPTGSPTIMGTFGTVKRPDGTTQLTFDGMPLYTFAGDTGPGQANGQGIGGVWFAVTASGATASGNLSSPQGSASGTGGGGGYGSGSSSGGYSYP